MKFLTIGLIVLLVGLVWYWGVRPFLMSRVAKGVILSPIRNAYIKQTKQMIKNYNISKDELFDE